MVLVYHRSRGNMQHAHVSDCKFHVLFDMVSRETIIKTHNVLKECKAQCWRMHAVYNVTVFVESGCP
jgi:hypothetical protein